MSDLHARTDPGLLREDQAISAGLKGSRRCQENAIERAHQRFSRSLAAYIRERVAPTLDGDEIATAVSETFCALARYAAEGKFYSTGALSTLLFTIARRKAIDILRKKTRKKRRAGEDDHTMLPVTEVELGHDGLSDDDVAVEVTQKLVRAPEISDLWRTAADEARTNEIIRRFRLWIGTLPRLQRKVAECMLTHFGSATDAEMAAELRNEGVQATPASVKSARTQIVIKFKSYIKETERTAY